MQPARIILPLIVGLIAAPSIILLHECGHYVIAAVVGLKPKLEYAAVNFTPPPQEFPGVVAAGPMVEALLAAGGIVLLWRLRSQRRAAVPDFYDWVATGCEMAAGRWLGSFTGIPELEDEAFLSRALGLPPSVLP